ncbi:glutathione S-transferase family protein [Hoeflea sp. TYP-13]|uniref:glutathione S-transferase family protein n=1 Tax=Hoeflea sp. TYP-13 TaxID=3230023 RepID=UPI0034C663CC
MIMYGAEVSYFSGKLRAYLNWKGVDFEEIQASREIYVGKILPNIGWPVIPVVELQDGTFLQDTTEIIRYIEELYPEPPVLPKKPTPVLASLLLELYGDEWLVLPAMHYRWNYNRDFAIAEFGALAAPDATPDEQRNVGERVAGPFAGALPALGIDKTTGQAIENSYLALLDELDHHFAAHDYVLGSAPTLGDFGLYGPLYAHMYRDPKSGEIMKQRAPNVCRWVECLRDGKDRGKALDSDIDTVPDTLLPILKRAMREQLPVLVDTVAQVEQFAANAADNKLPRAIGFHQFNLGEATGQRAIFPYAQWMLQHVTDQLHSVTPQDHSAVSDFLDKIEAGPLRELQITSRVKRTNFQLYLDR